MTDTFQLTPEEIEFFEENGYVGPFDLGAPEAVAAARRLIDEELVDRESPVYGVKVSRDRPYGTPHRCDAHLCHGDVDESLHE